MTDQLPAVTALTPEQEARALAIVGDGFDMFESELRAARLIVHLQDHVKELESTIRGKTFVTPEPLKPAHEREGPHCSTCACLPYEAPTCLGGCGSVTPKDFYCSACFLKARAEQRSEPPDEALDDHSELMKKLPNVRPELLDDLKELSRWALQRRVLIQADWLGSYSKCLDGLGLKVGVESARDPRDIRLIVDSLRATETTEGGQQ